MAGIYTDPVTEAEARLLAEAEARLLAENHGIGLSWMQVLHAEFKKDYMEKVHHYLLIVIQ